MQAQQFLYRRIVRADHHMLAAEEFIRRFLLHVLPKRFVRIRHYGLLAGRNGDLASGQEILTNGDIDVAWQNGAGRTGTAERGHSTLLPEQPGRKG